MGLRNRRNKIAVTKKYNGFRRYLFKIIMSNVFLVLFPICILGIFWSCMISNQAEKEFHQQKTIAMREIVNGIRQRIKTINLEVAVESRDRLYSTYTESDTYTTDLWMISKRLSAMVEKYYLLHSVYFYDETTGRIYNSNTGSYDFSSFYDVEWINNTKDTYLVQQLPLRYSMDKQSPVTFYAPYNKLVLTFVKNGKPDFYLVANISINKLFKDIISNYELANDEQEFFFLDMNGCLIEGECEYTAPGSLMQTLHAGNTDVSIVKQSDRIYFMNTLDYGIICVTSYPIKAIYHESIYLERYIIIVCFGLFIFLLFVSVYMSKKLYQPINTLYSDIATNTKNLNKENVSDEIDMLKHVFREMNIFNSNARLKLKQFDEITKSTGFRNFLERSQCQSDFLKEHPYLFGKDGNCRCEMLILKFIVSDMGMSFEEETLFGLNLQEVLRSYLHSSMKGILTKNGNDNLITIYRSSTGEHLEQIRKVLIDTVTKLTKGNVYFVVSHPITKVDEIIPQYEACTEWMETAYFFDWKNEIVTEDKVQTVNNNDEIYQSFLNINTALVRSIVSQNKQEVSDLFAKLERELPHLKNVSMIKDICSRIMVDMDNEFHFSKTLNYNLIQSMHESKTLTEMLTLIKSIIKQICSQYGRNTAKENHYCELAKKFLDEHYMDDMNITDVAEHLNISYSYLSKIFRANYRITLTDYLNNVRIEKSKDFLINTFLTIAEISENVGYNNVQSYQRFFKKYVNITPGDYRKLHNNRIKQ